MLWVVVKLCGTGPRAHPEPALHMADATAVLALGISSHARLHGPGLQQQENLGLDLPFEPPLAPAHEENKKESSDCLSLHAQTPVPAAPVSAPTSAEQSPTWAKHTDPAPRAPRG